MDRPFLRQAPGQDGKQNGGGCQQGAQNLKGDLDSMADQRRTTPSWPTAAGAIRIGLTGARRLITLSLISAPAIMYSAVMYSAAMPFARNIFP